MTLYTAKLAKVQRRLRRAADAHAAMLAEANSGLAALMRLAALAHIRRRTAVPIFCEALHNAPKLRWRELHEMHIFNKGTTALVAALMQLPHMQQLDDKFGYITGDFREPGAACTQAICGALTRCTAMVLLAASELTFTAQALSWLCDALVWRLRLRML